MFRDVQIGGSCPRCGCERMEPCESDWVGLWDIGEGMTLGGRRLRGLRCMNRECCSWWALEGERDRVRLEIKASRYGIGRKQKVEASEV